MSKRKLLLADDSITIQKVVNLTFADEGIEVISVSDGNSAMDKLRENMPDLIMADVNMPGLNGYEICEKIKQSENNSSKTPVILLVGSFEPFDEEEANRVGADDYLTKPFQSISQLVEKVNELLKVDEGENLQDTAEMPVQSSESPSIAVPQNTDSTEEDSDIQPLEVDFNDDEMIQTAQVGSVPVDDANKFETTLEIPSFEPEEQYKEQTSNLEEPDFNVTQKFTETDYQELSVERMDDDDDATLEIVSNHSQNVETVIEPQDTSAEKADPETIRENSETQVNDRGFESKPETSEFPVSETDFEIVDTQDAKHEVSLDVEIPNADESVYADEKLKYFEDSEMELENISTESIESEIEDIPMPEAASILELDELNLLDLPPLEVVDSAPVKSGIGAVNKIEIQEPITSKEFEEIADEVDPDVSAETVRVIAEKVLERVSEKEVRAIAWEVVPELADLIINKMAKEKLKD